LKQSHVSTTAEAAIDLTENLLKANNIGDLGMKHGVKQMKHERVG
jgi:hypothetical protein